MSRSFLFSRVRLPSFGTVAAVVSLIALAVLCFVAGSAVMFFQLPLSGFLGQAFLGFEAWRASNGQGVAPLLPPGAVHDPKVIKPEAAFAGYTRGAEVVFHRWRVFANFTKLTRLVQESKESQRCRGPQPR